MGRYMQEDSNVNQHMMSNQSNNNSSQASSQQAAYRTRLSQQPGGPMVGLPAGPNDQNRGNVVGISGIPSVDHVLRADAVMNQAAAAAHN